MVLKASRSLSLRVLDSDTSTKTLLWGTVAIVGSVVLLASSLHNGWVPHDTGQLGQTAQRILDGEMQHRDFDEPYTGALGHLNALAFRLTGIRAESMRWPLLAYASLFIVAIYILAARVTVPWVAALVTLLCASLTLPIYSASMPSWYNLFFTVFGVLALLEHLDTGRRRWLFWAGCCAGCSLAIKITGLYFVATGLLYIAFYGTVSTRTLSAETHRSGTQRTRTGGAQGRAYSALILTACVAFGMLGLAFTKGAQPWINLVHFTMPMMAVAACLAWQQWRHRPAAFWPQLKGYLLDLLPLSLGIAVAISLLLVPYIVTGSMGDLYRGLFVLPTLRVEHAALAPPELKWMCLSLPVTGLLIVGLFRPAKSLNKPFILAAIAFTCGVLFFASNSIRGYFYLFQALRNQIPLLVLVGMAHVVTKIPIKNRAAVFLVVTATALSSLVQYPYAYGSYFFFSAPLMVIAILYVVCNQPFAPKPIYAILLVFLLALAIVRIPQPDPRLLNGFYEPSFPTERMNLTRCKLRVYREDARVYRELVELIHSLTPPGSYIYAAPDCPEVYFLSGMKNATRTFYELFDGSVSRDRQQKLAELLDRQHVNVLVINHNPRFSDELSAHYLEALHARYPNSQTIRGALEPGEPPTDLFTILWRRPPPTRSSGG